MLKKSTDCTSRPTLTTNRSGDSILFTSTVRIQGGSEIIPQIERDDRLYYPPYLEAVSSIRNLRTRHAVLGSIIKLEYGHRKRGESGVAIYRTDGINSPLTSLRYTQNDVILLATWTVF
ncbi:hypothetical protein ANN_08560 [Periplaneta americana]|uniref:Uncharacterized protein n=1 Tax=Periplaneta americana TaxID=6978 RepID=A0ABQ8T2Y5_PERAM|nr:hypothetical protein ANN_08560 [Periplaneta americana]